MSEEEVMRKLMDSGFLMPVLSIVCGTIIAIIAIVFSLVRSMVVTKAREATKREISAYVAEGTIDPDKAVAILEADKPFWEKSTSKSRSKWKAC